MEFDLNLSAECCESSTNEEESRSLGETPVNEEMCYPSGLDELGSLLTVGSSFMSLEEAIETYERYATTAGFNVRKGTQSYFIGTKVPRMKVLVCSAEGNPDTKRCRDRLPAYRKQITRTKCQARLRLCREMGSKWVVSVFADDHNHELSPSGTSHLLRSARRMTTGKQHMIESFAASGIGVARACRYMEKESGVVRNVGFLKRDAYAHLYKTNRKTKIENGDAYELLKFFIQRSLEEPFFFWNVQLDDEGRLMNFFFRDTRAAIDYDYFGDVISVDTTFRTNKYDLICCPFVGINHHRRNILLGIAFLSDETTESFEWVLGTFAESMYGKEPMVIFTDQCQALMNAIEKTLTRSTHRLCQWHINQNACAHFGALNGNAEFKRLWYHCMNGCESVEEFENAWHTMITEHGLGNKRWFNNMYGLRQRWATVFTNDKFSAGLHATSRSESANRAIKEVCCHTTSLFDLVTKLSSRQEEWRMHEAETDAINRWKPGQIVKNNPILLHAADIYTRDVFKYFESQVANSLNLRIVGGPVTSNCTISYALTTVGEVGREVHVVVNEVASELLCSCRFWETQGILCSHIVHIMLVRNMTQIPDKYIMRRWTKEAKNRINGGTETEPGLGEADTGSLGYINRNMRLLYDLLVSVKNDCTRRNVLQTKLSRLFHDFNALGGEARPSEADRKQTERSVDIGEKQKFKNPPPGRRGARGGRKKNIKNNTPCGRKKPATNTRSQPLGNEEIRNTPLGRKLGPGTDTHPEEENFKKRPRRNLGGTSDHYASSRDVDRFLTDDDPVIPTQSSQNFGIA